MANYLLRNIDDALWQRVKECAAKEGRNIRFVLLACLRAYARHGYAAIKKPNGRNHHT